MDSLSPSLAIYPFNRPSHFVDAVFFTRLLPRSLSRQDRCCGHLPQPQYNRLRPLHLRITLYWKQGLRFPLQRDSPYGSASPDDLLQLITSESHTTATLCLTCLPRARLSLTLAMKYIFFLCCIRQVYYNEDNTKYVICEKPEKSSQCANSCLLPVKFSDHVNYFNTPTTYMKLQAD